MITAISIGMESVASQKNSYKFPKRERLHHRSLSEGLFRCGKSFYEFPFRVTWRILSDEELEKTFLNEVPSGIDNLQFMVTVPKKKRKKAIDRVLMRRRIRESWRLNRMELKKELRTLKNASTLSVSLVYIHNQNLPYLIVDDKVRLLITKLRNKLLTFSTSQE